MLLYLANVVSIQQGQLYPESEFGINFMWLNSSVPPPRGQQRVTTEAATEYGLEKICIRLSHNEKLFLLRHLCVVPSPSLPNGPTILITDIPCPRQQLQQRSPFSALAVPTGSKTAQKKAAGQGRNRR